MLKIKLRPKEVAESVYEEFDSLTPLEQVKVKRKMILSMGRRDFPFFCDFFLSNFKKDKKTREYMESADFHYELADSYTGDDSSIVIVPRDHAKTTVGIMTTLFEICYELEPSTLLIMGEWLGTETIGKIRDELEENHVIREYFGLLVPSKTKQEANKQWTKSSLQMNNGTEVKTVTFGGKIRWRRPTKINVDDPQETKDCLNSRIAEAFYWWFNTSVVNTLDPWATVNVIWTIVHPLCLVNLLKTRKEEEYGLVEYTAIDGIRLEHKKKWEKFKRSDGSKWVGKNREHIVGWVPLWAEKWTLAALDKRLGKIGYDAFMQEYMNVPTIVNSSPFYRKSLIERAVTLEKSIDETYNDLRLYREPYEEIRNEKDEVIETKKMKLYYGVDTANGNPDWDYTTVVVRDEWFNLYAVYRGRIDDNDLITLLDYMITDLGYEPDYDCLGIENNRIAPISVIKEREPKWMRKLFMQEDIDKISNKKKMKYWWNTNSKTRDLMFSTHKRLLAPDEDGDDLLVEIDSRQLNEMNHFYYNDKWKPEAMSPEHDDTICADAICCQMIINWWHVFYTSAW